MCNVKEKTERWKIINDFNGKYSISSLGRIKNNLSNEFLNYHIDPKGFWRMMFCFGGKKIIRLAHRLVADYFIEKPCRNSQKNLKVGFRDGNKLNIFASNLFWEGRQFHCKRGGAVTSGAEQQIYFNETWKIISIDGDQYPYYISNYGKVKNLKEYIIAPKISPTGYYRVTLWRNGRGKTISNHKLVLLMFGETNYENKPIINHKDCDKLNNFVGNLEWCTYQRNTEHAAENLRFGGENHPKTKLKNVQVLEIRELARRGWKTKNIAIKYNIRPAVVSAIKHGRVFKYI